MACVVADTSPLFYLAQLKRLPLLHSLHGQVIAPASVWAEARAGTRVAPAVGPRLAEALDAGWIAVHAEPAAESSDAALAGLDRGERDALGLARALRADLVLIDEKNGRAVAERLGLAITGTVGILAEAKRKGFLSALAPELQHLRQRTTFRLSRELEQLALRLVGETAEPNP